QSHPATRGVAGAAALETADSGRGGWNLSWELSLMGGRKSLSCLRSCRWARRRGWGMARRIGIVQVLGVGGWQPCQGELELGVRGDQEALPTHILHALLVGFGILWFGH